MLEPIKIEAYHCSVCEQDLIKYSLEEATKHVNVPVNETKLPVGLFYKGRENLNYKYYHIIKLNEGKLSSDHSIIHIFETLYGLIGVNEPYHHLSEDELSFRDIFNKFKKRIFKTLSPEEFKEFFSNQESLRFMHLDRWKLIRTCPELETLAIQA